MGGRMFKNEAIVVDEEREEAKEEGKRARTSQK
jgi:hypothetical protein